MVPKGRIGTAIPSSQKQPNIVDKIFCELCLCPRTLTPRFDPTWVAFYLPFNYLRFSLFFKIRLNAA